MPEMTYVSFGEGDERLKVVMPLTRNRPYMAIYAALLVVWVGATFVLLGLLLRQPIASMEFIYILVYVVIVAAWAYAWYRLGKHVMRYLGYYGATREILFLNEQALIVRRPFSIMGVTDAFDMAHVGPFQYSESQRAISFDYGSRAGLFGSGLDRTEAEQLADYLNKRYVVGKESANEDDIFS